MPEQELVLPPGGQALYKLPMNKEYLFLMIKPGKKEEGSGSPFSNKANITVAAATTEEASWAGLGVEVNCSQNSHSSSSVASYYCTLDLAPLQNPLPDFIFITIAVPAEETRNAYLWQLHLSPLDDSERVEATFQDDGRQLMRQTQQDPASDTWLTMVSIVGNTGVGKSTVASLLSGNETMFKAKASTAGTTTIGADISTIIPANDYSQRMEAVLEMGPLYDPDQSRPLFMIDSEGMSFRGNEVDFVTTGPVAVIANIIIWITTNRLRPTDILEDVADYMQGLDRITMGDQTSDGQDYGEFVIVLNMMQETDQGVSDDEICSELMNWGSSDEDDAIREEMEMRFKEIVCIGLPTIAPDDFPLEYPTLAKYPRFREGLHKLGNRMLQESETPLDVRVGNSVYEMNSTEAETIIGMMIDAANQGNIDLSDICNVLFSISKEKVIQELGKITTEMQYASEGMCDNATQVCTNCVCNYRNEAVRSVETKVTNDITFAMEEAETLCADPKVRESIGEIIEDILNPWKYQNLCNGILKKKLDPKQVCDISELQNQFDDFHEDDLLIECDVLHICDTTTIHNFALSLVTNQIFISNGAVVEQRPKKAANGDDAQDIDTTGGDGLPGETGRGITLLVSGSLLTGSQQKLAVVLHGGEGGDGGQGGPGNPAVPGSGGVAGAPGGNGANGSKGEDGFIYKSVDTSGDAKSCTDVIHGKDNSHGGNNDWGRDDHCCHVGNCVTHKRWILYTWHYYAESECDEARINGKPGTAGGPGTDGEDGGAGGNATPATRGADGGRGGDGGESGPLEVVAPGVSLEVEIQKIGGVGGEGGLPGRGGDGALGGSGAEGGTGGSGGHGGEGGEAGHCVHQRREWTAHDNWYQSHSCDDFCFGCDKTWHQTTCSNFAVGKTESISVSKPGKPGAPGPNGANGANGKPGAKGQDAAPGEDGNPGERGEDAAS